MADVLSNRGAAVRRLRFALVGWGLALVSLVVWMGVLKAVFRVAPPAPPVRYPPAPATLWWAGPELLAAEVSVVADARAYGSPSQFALLSPVGFTHRLRRDQLGLTPPDTLPAWAPPYAAVPAGGRGAGAAGGAAAGVTEVRLSAAGAEGGASAAFAGVERVALASGGGRVEASGVQFAPGWEARLFSGVDVSFAQWTNEAWGARMELRFDGRGVPEQALIVRGSGLAEVDARLAREVRGWRLMEETAPRAGWVSWRVPAEGGGRGGAGLGLAGKGGAAP